MDDLVPSWDACQVDMGCWPDHGNETGTLRHLELRSTDTEQRCLLKVLLWCYLIALSRRLASGHLWPSLAGLHPDFGFCGPSDLRWVQFPWLGHESLRHSGAELNPEIANELFLWLWRHAGKDKNAYVCYIMIISWAYRDHMMILWLYGYIIYIYI